MKKIFVKIWKDSVGGNLISAGILGIISIVYSYVSASKNEIDFKSAFISFWTLKIELWTIAIVFISVLSLYRIVKKIRGFRYKTGEFDFDKQIYLKIRDEILPHTGSIDYLRRINFAGGSFKDEALNDIDLFESERTNPRFHFFHPELESLKNEMLENIWNFNNVLSGETFPTSQGRQTVPPEWQIEQPERFLRVINDLHDLKNRICKNYDDLINKGRIIFKI